jgi:hypothetical protein
MLRYETMNPDTIPVHTIDNIPAGQFGQRAAGRPPDPPYTVRHSLQADAGDAHESLHWVAQSHPCSYYQQVQSLS